MNKEDLINKIIPKADYQHRNGFSNNIYIDNLTTEEKIYVEDELIERLSRETPCPDSLIVETLEYMQSEKAVPVLVDLLKQCPDPVRNICIAKAIFKLNRDKAMVDIAITSFNRLDPENAYYKYSIIDVFYYLASFQSEATTEIIKKFIKHKDYLVSYNAKRALELNNL